MKIKLPIILNPWQREVDSSDARFKLVKAGRRSGKTKYSVFWLIRQAMRSRNEVLWHLSPTYKRAIEDVWPVLLRMVPAAIRARIHLSDHSISMVNGSRIYIKSSDDPKNLRGGKLGGVVMEEADFQRDMVWSEIVRPMLLDLSAPALFISSPKPDWFCRLRERVLRGELGPEWATWHHTVWDNAKSRGGVLDDAEIEKIRLSETDTTWRREYLAEELVEEGRMYPEFQHASVFHTGQRFEDIPSLPMVVGIDWGCWEDPAAFSFLRITRDGRIILDDEYIQGNTDVDGHAPQVKKREHGFNVKRRVLSSDAFSRVGDQRLTIADRFRMAGLPCVQASRKRDGGIDLMKRLFRGWGGKPWLYVNSKCRNFLKHVREADYDKHEPDILAAVRYGVWDIVNTGMTSILTLPKFDPPIEPYVARLKDPRARSKPLRWNFQEGVPL